MPVLHFSSDSVLLQKEVLKKCDKEFAYSCHTNKYRSLLAELWRHAFPITYAEIEMPRWESPLRVTIYKKPTRCNSGSIVFIKNHKYVLHVSDVLCGHHQEHYKL